MVPPPRGTRREGARHALAGAVRLGRRGRRPDPRNATSPGGRGRATLAPGFPVGRAEVTDLLERPQHESDLSFALQPFQILTVRLRPE
ncbi:glycosyl hydrolase-related protein [Streptomyces sp. NPDC002092]